MGKGYECSLTRMNKHNYKESYSSQHLVNYCTQLFTSLSAAQEIFYVTHNNSREDPFREAGGGGSRVIKTVYT